MSDKSPEPSDIFTELDSCPPLMREEAKNVYLSTHVDWLLTFSNGEIDPQKQARLILRYDPHSARMVVASVALHDYPWLRSTPTGKLIQVSGRISKIEPLWIELNPVVLSLFEETEASH